MQRKKLVFNWSGGKDSALALLQLLKDDSWDVVSLLTTVNRETQLSTMHSIPVCLLELQAQSIGLPLYVVDLTPKGNMADYSLSMERAVLHFKELGVCYFGFGDIFLHDVLSYRVAHLSPYGIEVVEPLWNKTTAQIMDDFLASGLLSVVVTVTEGSLSERFLGRTLDRQLVSEFPTDIDVCGENGEYHTFCYGGDLFKSNVPFTLGTPTRCTYSVGHDDGTTRDYTYWFVGLS